MRYAARSSSHRFAAAMVSLESRSVSICSSSPIQGRLLHGYGCALIAKPINPAPALAARFAKRLYDDDFPRRSACGARILRRRSLHGGRGYGRERAGKGADGLAVALQGVG